MEKRRRAQAEDEPAYYVYHQQFEHDGKTINRRGFMGRVRLQPFGEGNIYPHEETHPKAKVDRLKLTTATRQNNSQIFGLYPDPENEVITLLDKASEGLTPRRGDRSSGRPAHAVAGDGRGGHQPR